MAISTIDNVTFPNRKNDDPSNDRALIVEHFTGTVENTIARKSVTENWVPVQTVKNTDTISNFAVGETTLGRVQADQTPQSTKVAYSKKTLTIDALINARNRFPLLELFKAAFDVRKVTGEEHGKKIAKFKDQAFIIQAVKAAQLQESTYGSLPGYTGGSQHTLGAEADKRDPAKLYYAISQLLEKMEDKDVDPLSEDVAIFVRPQQYYTLLNSDNLINSQFITSAGNKIETKVLSSFGVPVFSTNNLPKGVVTDHLLGPQFNGDFSNVAAVAFSPRALLAGSLIPLECSLFYNEMDKHWILDSHLSFGVTPSRPEFSGVILTP